MSRYRCEECKWSEDESEEWSMINVWLQSSVGRASHRYRGCHGFESCWSPDFQFRLLLSSCLNWKIYWDDHSSLSLRGITALLLSITKGNKNLRHKRLSLLCSAWNKKKSRNSKNDIWKFEKVKNLYRKFVLKTSQAH